MEKMRKMKKKILGLRGRKKEEEAEQQPQEEKKKGEPSPPPHHPPNHHPPTSAGPGGVPGYPSLLRPDLWKGHRAAADGDLSLLRRQLRKQPGLRDTQDPGGRTPLHLACAYGRLDVAAFLINSKCQLDLCDSDMRTPLMKAVQCRQETCAIHLLECGADPNVADARGDTALHLAASTASRSLGQHLLDHGARLEAPNQDGITPLMAAVVENDCDMVEFLLKNGASVHAADKARRTPLLLAVANKKRDASKLLLAYDSDVSHQDDSGWSARDYAELSDDPVLLQYIADYSKRKKGGESSSDALRIFSVLNSPVRAGDPGVTLGAPATNIEVIDDPSAGDSVRDSVKTDDTWRSSEEEELEPSPKKPSLARLLSFSQRPKQNLDEESSVPTDPVVGVQPNRSVCDARGANEFLPKSLFHARSFPQPVRSSPGSFSRHSQMAAYVVSKQEGSFEEEKEKDDEEDGESPGVAAQPLHGPAISLNQIPPREESAKKGLLKLGAGEEEKEEEEEKDLDSPWDSESLPESPRRPTLPSLPASPAKIKTPMHTLMEEPGGSANVKPELDTMDLEPAAASSTLLKQGGAREKAQADLMEELGLDNADDIEDASDWDSTSLSQGLPCPDAYDALTWGDPSHPAHLTPGSACPGTSGPARVEEATVMETSVALKGPLRPDINTEETGEGEAKVQELARKKEPGNPETTSAANIQEETEQKRQADKKNHCFGTKEASRGAMSEDNHGTDTASSSDKVGFAPVLCKGINPTAGLNDQRKRGHPRPVSKRRASPPALGDRHQRPDSSSWSDTSLEEKHPGKTPNRRNKAGERRDPDEELAWDNATLREEVATLRAELSRLRLRREDDERRHLEDNGALQEKTDELRKELKRSEEALAQAVSQRDGQAAALKTEAARLATQMDHLKGDRERLESEADALRARLGAAARELEESQDSREGLERALQRERDEAQRLKDRLEDEARALREANGGLSQRLGQAESRANALEGELLRATHALRDKTLLLESTQRDLAEARGHAEELDGALRREKEQASQWAAKGEAVQERLAQLQSDNLLLRQQLEDLQSQGLLKERAAAGAQETFREIVAHLRAEAEKRVQQVEERNQELAARCADLREQIGRHEAGEANQEGALRQLQQELADALKKQSMSEASLEVSVRCRNKLEEDKQQLQEEIERIQSRLENEQRKVKELKELKQSAELRLEQEMKRSNELQKEYNGMRKLVKAAKKKLKEYENGEASPQASFNRGLKNQCSEIDVELEQLRKKADDLSLQLEAESARRAQLESANAELRAELFSTQRLQKSHDDLQKSKLQLEEEIVSLRHQLQRHAFDLDQAERYKRDAEDRAKQEVRQKLEEVNLFLQTQAASQEALENIRAANHAALRHQLETRIRDLESELGKLQRSQQEVDLLKESAHSKLERANEMLAESNARLLQERSRSGSLLPGGFWGGSLLADPIPETLSFGGLAFSRPVGLAGGLVNPAGRPRASKRRVEAYVAKMQKKMEQAIKTELDKSRAEMNAASARILSGSSTLLNQNPDPVSRAYQEYLEEMRKNLGI